MYNIILYKFKFKVCWKLYLLALNVEVKLLQTKKQGLSFEFQVACQQSDCDFFHSFWTSKKKKKKRKFDVNSRIYYTTRRIGNGYEGLKRFLQLLNHPPPMTKKNYGKITSNVLKAVKDVSTTIMNEACDEIRGPSIGIVNTGVSNDGTQQKRGFTSLNGAVASISITTGKILDCEVVSRFCQGCVYIQKFKNNQEYYESYKNDHKCSINHVGSAPSMEMKGIEKIFSR